MSVYPMYIQTLSMHQATKSYHLMLIKTADGRSLFVRRWGKKGVFGEIKAELYPDTKSGEAAWDKLERAKTRGGYRVEGLVKTEGIMDAATLRTRMGMVYPKVGRDAIKHLDPEIDTSGMRELDPPRLNEEGKLSGEDQPRRDDEKLKRLMEEQQAAERAEADAVLKQNPNYGRFG